MVAVAVNPGKQVDDDVFRVRDVPLASGTVQAVAKVAEGGEAAAGFDEALDDFGGFGRLIGVPVVATASAMRRSLMMVSSRANLRLRTLMRRRIWEMVMGLPRTGRVFTWMDRMDRIDGLGLGWWTTGIFWEIPLISAHFRLFE